MARLFFVPLMFILVCYPLNLKAQLKRFREVKWEVKVEPGLNNRFKVNMQLIDAKGKITHVNHENGSFYWQAFSFVSDYPVVMVNGVGFYKQSLNFQGVDSIKVQAICENEDLNTNFYIPVKYCTGLELATDSLSFEGKPSPGWIMIMNTNERFPYDKNWLDFNQLQSVSDSRLEVTDAGISVNSKEPFAIAHVRLIEPTTSRLIFDKDFTIRYPELLKLDFSGKSGRRGQNGQKGTIPGESGDNGTDGEDGTPGEEVMLFIEPFEKEGMNLLVIHSVYRKRWRDYYVNADQMPQIFVNASGGNGGDGGDGGAGANAKIETETNSRNRAGAGGNGGYGGHAGDGGNVEVFLLKGTTFDEEKLTVDVSAGRSGSSGNPGGGGINETGILESMLVGNKQQSGNAGMDGNGARDGNFRGIRTVNETVFREMMQEQGW